MRTNGPGTHRIVTGTFTDLEQFGSAQRDGDADHTQLGAAPLNLRRTHAEFGTLTIQCNEVNSTYLAQARFHRDRWAMFFDIGAQAGRSRLNGHTMGQFGAVLYGPAAGLHARAEQGQAWAMITFGQSETTRMLEDVEPPAEGTCMLMPDALVRAPRLAVMARELSATIWTDPDRLSGAAAAGAIVEDFMWQLGVGLGAGRERAPGRAIRRRVSLVAAAKEFLDTASHLPIYTEAVSRELGVSSRSLNDAFEAVHGMTLQRYLLVRRLNLARRHLRGAEGPVLVKQVALRLGFWHFGRFSRAYRTLFGETPSATLATSRQ